MSTTSETAEKPLAGAPSKSLVEGLKEMIEEWPPVPTDAPEYQHVERRVLHGMLAALTLRFEQLGALIETASLTWRDDSKIKATTPSPATEQ